jgi:hypothetical protein
MDNSACLLTMIDDVIFLVKKILFVSTFKVSSELLQIFPPSTVVVIVYRYRISLPGIDLVDLCQFRSFDVNVSNHANVE